MTTTQMMQLRCSCGWTHEAESRASATKWKAWHRRQHQAPGQRISDTGHDVTITKTQPSAASSTTGGVDYLLRNIDARQWEHFALRAQTEGRTMRAVLQLLIADYVNHGLPQRGRKD